MERVGGPGGSALAIQISQAGWTDVIYLSIYYIAPAWWGFNEAAASKRTGPCREQPLTGIRGPQGIHGHSRLSVNGVRGEHSFKDFRETK